MLATTIFSPTNFYRNERAKNLNRERVQSRRACSSRIHTGIRRSNVSDPTLKTLSNAPKLGVLCAPVSRPAQNCDENGLENFDPNQTTCNDILAQWPGGMTLLDVHIDIYWNGIRPYRIPLLSKFIDTVHASFHGRMNSIELL